MALDDDVKEHLDAKFDDFLSGLIKKFRWPAIGVAVIFAAFMSAFATYTYVKARSEVSAAQVQFYQNMMKTQQDIELLKIKFIEKFNLLMTDLDATAAQQAQELERQISEAKTRLRNGSTKDLGRFEDAKTMSVVQIYHKLKRETDGLDDKRFEEYMERVRRRVNDLNDAILTEKFGQALALVERDRHMGNMSMPPLSDKPDAPPAKLVPDRDVGRYKIDPDEFRQQQQIMQAPPQGN